MQLMIWCEYSWSQIKVIWTSIKIEYFIAKQVPLFTDICVLEVRLEEQRYPKDVANQRLLPRIWNFYKVISLKLFEESVYNLWTLERSFRIIHSSKILKVHLIKVGYYLGNSKIYFGSEVQNRHADESLILCTRFWYKQTQRQKQLLNNKILNHYNHGNNSHFSEWKIPPDI